VRMDPGTDGDDMYLLHNGPGDIVIRRRPDNFWVMFIGNASFAQGVNVISDAPQTADGFYHHLLLSWNLATVQFYIDDVPQTSSISGGAATDNWADGSQFWRMPGDFTTPFFKGDVADFYINPTAAPDLSVTANRRLFRSASGHPVDLGSDGHIPTGSVSMLYMSGPLASWATNKGSGGIFTNSITGALLAASSNP
jgi:hypothetical protein